MYPHELSGGMKQRVCIAIGILLSPKVIIADEPTSALDVVTQRQVMETIDRVQKKINAAVILIGHDMGLMAQFVDKVAVMYAGRLVEISTVRDMFTEPQTSLFARPDQQPAEPREQGGVSEHSRARALAAAPAERLRVSSSLRPRDRHLRREAPRCRRRAERARRDLSRLRRTGVRMTHLLELRNISKIYSRGLFNAQASTALRDISLTLRENEPSILTIAGESGSGKTTLAMLLLGFIKPTTGEILYRGKDIGKLRGSDRLTFRREVQAVFQDPFAVFNPFYTVDHLLSVPIRRFKLASSKAEARTKMDEALTAVGLRPEDVLGRFPHQLSGGQRQRINVARALLLKPRLLVADEPVSMVDASLRANILETLRNLQRDHGVSIVYITHDLTTAFHIAKSIIVLYRGSVMEAGDVDMVIKDPRHPYTRLLVDSIPWPDLQRRWGERPIKARAAAGAGDGCSFRSRCPAAMEICRTQPPLFRIDAHHTASCHLFAEQPKVAPETLSEFLPV